MSHSSAAHVDQDSSEEANAPPDPSRRHRDAARNCATKGGENSANIRKGKKIGKLLLETYCPKSGAGKPNPRSFGRNNSLTVPYDFTFRHETEETLTYCISPGKEPRRRAEIQQSRKTREPTQLDAAATQLVLAHLRMSRTPQQWSELRSNEDLLVDTFGPK